MQSEQLNSQSTYIYTTDLFSISTLYYNLFNAYLLCSASATHTASDDVSFQNSLAKWLANALLSLGQPSLSNAYPSSTHGRVHRIIASSQISSQLLVAITFNGTLPSMRLPHDNLRYKVILHALCPQRIMASTHNSLPSPLRLHQNCFHQNMLPSTHS